MSVHDHDDAPPGGPSCPPGAFAPSPGTLCAVVAKPYQGPPRGAAATAPVAALALWRVGEDIEVVVGSWLDLSRYLFSVASALRSLSREPPAACVLAQFTASLLSVGRPCAVSGYLAGPRSVRMRLDRGLWALIDGCEVCLEQDDLLGDHGDVELEWAFGSEDLSALCEQTPRPPCQ